MQRRGRFGSDGIYPQLNVSALKANLFSAPTTKFIEMCTSRKIGGSGTEPNTMLLSQAIEEVYDPIDSINREIESEIFSRNYERSVEYGD